MMMSHPLLIQCHRTLAFQVVYGDDDDAGDDNDSGDDDGDNDIAMHGW